MRWLIRRAVIREPRFGETRLDVLGWTVQPYITLADGDRQTLGQPVPFEGITAARRYAVGEARRFADAAQRNALAAESIVAAAS